MKTDILILGGGPSGYVAAIRASQLNKSVILVEKENLGGTCMNKGCIPTKALLKISELSTELNNREFGMLADENSDIHNFAVQRKDKIIKNMRNGVKSLLESYDVQTVYGNGLIKDAHTITVQTENGERVIEFDKLILATGSKCANPSFIKGLDNDGVIDSDKALQLESLPKSLVIIGGGVIGVEFATYFSVLGVKVTVLEFRDNILAEFDQDVCQCVERSLKKQGIAIQTSAKVLSVSKRDGLDVEYEKSGELQTINCENVLIAVGRKPNLDGLEPLGLETKNGAVIVDENMRTSVEGVFACGDVVGGKLLAHLAYAEGRMAAEIAAVGHSKINLMNCPACVYTTPEIAVVGITEKEAVECGIKFRMAKCDVRTNGRAQTLGQRDGFVKLLTNENQEIIGGVVVCASASEIIGEIALAVNAKLKVDVLANTIHPHPSISEIVWESANMLIGKPIHSK